MAVSLKGGFSRGRRWAGAAEGLGSAVVVIALVAAIVYAATRPAARVRLDLTEGAQYTLTDQTKRIASELDKSVSIVTVFRPEPQAIPNGLFEVQAKAADYVRNLLEEYVVASGGQLSVRHLDPHVDSVEVKALVQEVHLTRSNVVVVRCEDRIRQVYLEDLVTIDRGLADPNQIQPAVLRQFHGEGPLTSSLLSVTSEDPIRVGFLVGYGEMALDDFDRFGLGLVAESLRGQGIEVSTFDFSKSDQVPDDLDVVAVFGPLRPLGRRVTDALLEHHRGGGALLLAFDPGVHDPAVDELLDTLGVRRNHSVLTLDDVVFEGPRRNRIEVRHFTPDHEVTEPIARQGVFAALWYSGALIRSPVAPPSLRVVPLVLTPDNVFADVPLGPEQPGNYVRDEGEPRGKWAAAFASDGGPARAVVFGGSAFANNSFVGSTDGGPGNMDLVLNSVNWLAEREAAVASRPRDFYESRVDLYEDEKTRVFVYVVALMPLGGALLGLLVWFARRR